MTPIRIAPSKAISAAWKLCTQPRTSTPKRDGRADDEDDLDFLAEGALFAEQQHAKAPRPHQHAADGRGHAEADQQGYENERLVQSQWLVES